MDAITGRTQKGMIRSSIDIGTNSVLLLVADCGENGIQVLHEEQHIPRLGQGVDQAGALSKEAQQRVLQVLNTYKDFLNENYTSTVFDTVITATSAVRDASNRKEFLDEIKAQTGWTVTLLSGDDEARITYRGALSVISPSDSTSKNRVLDIGGGSTEIAFGSGKRLSNFVSLNMGSVRFTERFLKHNPPAVKELESARNEVCDMLSGWKQKPEVCDQLVGVAGTVTSIAGIELGLNTYEANKINGHRCSRDFIEEMIQRLQKLTAAEIEREYPVFLKGRGDVIVAGLLILSEFMKWSGKDEIVVSTGGVRHGILLEESA